MEQLTFNSSVDRDDYAVIKDEAFKLNITVKEHISNIVTSYAKQKQLELKKEEEENDNN
jgi:hypothetical protein